MQCPACGQENPKGFRFCGSCGAVLDAATSRAREERKIVTVLFADLVGFTARAESMDPEDVRRLLTPYHTRLRQELERFGGTVEKFIGDAVMALFGAPAAHEDDPERAVRAAIAIRDWAQDQAEPLEVRIAINTGEALVALGARPQEGEAMASGDVVNTAARLQAAAPVNGILVGETTYRATRHVIDYREAAPVAAKGKAEPVPVWEALTPRAQVGVDVVQSARAPLVGRGRELALLVDTASRVRDSREPQLVTLVGVPGIGKSRLTFELLQVLTADPGEWTWRQGRCLPYGDGVTFWPIGEIVKSHAEIFETDSPERAREKLERMLAGLFDDPAEALDVERQLRQLVGAGAETGHGSDLKAAFAAWRAFLRTMFRLCSSSRTFSGQTPRCWISSTTSSTGRMTSRSS
jgi:class 3 adenylate cyclase